MAVDVAALVLDWGAELELVEGSVGELAGGDTRVVDGSVAVPADGGGVLDDGGGVLDDGGAAFDDGAAR